MQMDAIATERSCVSFAEKVVNKEQEQFNKKLFKKAGVAYVRMVYDVSHRRHYRRGVRVYGNRFRSGGYCQIPVRCLLDSVRSLPYFWEKECKLT